MKKPISIFISLYFIFTMIMLSGCSQHDSNIPKNEQVPSSQSNTSDTVPAKDDVPKLEVPSFDQKQYKMSYSYEEEGQLYNEVAPIVEDTEKIDELFGKPVTVESVRGEGDDYAEIRTYNGIIIRRWDTVRSPYGSKGLIGIEAWGAATPIFRNLKIGDTLEDISARLANNDDKPTNESDRGYKYLYYNKDSSFARIEPDDPDFHYDMLIVQDDVLRYRIYLDKDGKITRYAVNNTY
jgi:hypothetical protein